MTAGDRTREDFFAEIEALRSRVEALEKLSTAHDELEYRVQERTAELLLRCVEDPAHRLFAETIVQAASRSAEPTKQLLAFAHEGRSAPCAPSTPRWWRSCRRATASRTRRRRSSTRGGCGFLQKPFRLAELDHKLRDSLRR